MSKKTALFKEQMQCFMGIHYKSNVQSRVICEVCMVLISVKNYGRTTSLLI